MVIHHSNFPIGSRFHNEDHKLIQMKHSSLLSELIIYARLSLLLSTCGYKTGNDNLSFVNQGQMRLFQ